MLRFVQVSDIHFGQENRGEIFFHNDVRDRLISDCERLSEARPADFVVVTGDIAFSGGKAQFDAASDWLERLCVAAGASTESVLAVPGNHDVDWNQIDYGTKLVHEETRRRTPANLQEHLADIGKMDRDPNPILAKLDAYRTFALSMQSPLKSFVDPAWTKQFDVGGVPVRFLGLTTVLLSDVSDQQGSLVLGEQQFVGMTREEEPVYVALLHHHPTWLKDRERAEEYLNSRVSLLLYGHEHTPRFEMRRIRGFERVELGAGAVTATDVDGYMFRYNWVELEVAETKLRVSVWPRMWNRLNTRFEADGSQLNGRDQLVEEIDVAEKVDRVRKRRRLADNSRQVPPTVSSKQRELQREKMDDQSAFDALQRFFWRYLDWSKRIHVLVEFDLIPEGLDRALPQTVELQALESARADGRLSALWDRVMQDVPSEKRRANPFTAQED